MLIRTYEQSEWHKNLACTQRMYNEKVNRECIDCIRRLEQHLESTDDPTIREALYLD